MLLPMKRHILLTAIVSSLLIFAIVPSFASSFSLSSGQNAPDFHLADLSNTNHSLSDYKGNIVVLDFFSVGYSTCQAGAKNVLVPLYNNYSSGDANVKFLSVETTGATADTINSTYVNSTGIKWPILTGGDNLKNHGTPTVYIVDPTGKIVFSMAYPLKTVALKAAIDPLLEASANEKSKTTPDNKSTATPTPTNPSAIPTEKPSTTPTPTPTPAASNAILDANTSNVSKVTPSSESTVASSPTSSESTVASSPTSSESTVASSPTSSESVTPVSTTSGIQEENSSAGLENCSMAVTQKACVSTSSQTYLMYSPSLITSIVPSTVLAQVATMSAEATALSQNAVPTIALPAQTNSTASLPLQSVYEFSLLGLGAPALLIGVLYLLLRKV